MMEVTLIQAASYRCEDDMGVPYLFKKGVPKSVPNSVGGILTRTKPGLFRVNIETITHDLVTAPTAKQQATTPQKVVQGPKTNIRLGMPVLQPTDAIPVMAQIAYSQKEEDGKSGATKYEIKDLSELDGKTVLIVKSGGIGDVLFTTPIIRLIKECVPSAILDFATTQSLTVLMEKNPNVRKVLSIAEAKTVKGDYDKILNLTGGIAANQVAEHLHCVDAMAEWIGIKTPNGIADKHLELYPTRGSLIAGAKLLKEAGIIPDSKNSHKRGATLQPKVIGIGISASSRLRTWPVEYIRKLIEAIIERTPAKVLLLGKSLDPANLSGFPSDRVVSTVNATSLSQLIGVIWSIDAYVGTDSGILWIAQALKKLAVGIFGAFPSGFRVDPEGTVSSIDADVKCGPCYFHDAGLCDFTDVNGVTDCMKNVSPANVFDLVKEIIRQ